MEKSYLKYADRICTIAKDINATKIYAIVEEACKEAKKEAKEDKPRLVCPNCEEEVNGAFVFCPYCKTTLCRDQKKDINEDLMAEVMPSDCLNCEKDKVFGTPKLLARTIIYNFQQKIKETLKKGVSNRVIDIRDFPMFQRVEAWYKKAFKEAGLIE